MAGMGKWAGCLVLLQLVAGACALGQSAAGPVEVKVHLDQPIAPFRPITNWFGYDEANYTTAANGRKLLRELHDLSPVPVFVRAHHLLTSGDGVPELKWSSTNVYSEDAAGKPVYDFRLLDGIMDAYQAAGVRPMVELGFMPKDLAAHLAERKVPYQVHYPASTVSGESNNPPRDYARWGELVRTVVSHLVSRYGRERVLGWYFEVWNDPDIDYWHGTPEEYFRLYDYAVAAVREALPGAVVGGPATTGPGSEQAAEFLERFLEHVEQDRSAANGGEIPLDFVSFHAKGHPSFANGQVTMGLKNELRDVDRGFAIVAGHARFRQLPIILSEADPEGCAACSSKVNPANNYRNGTLYPTYTAAALKALYELADEHRVNLLAMLSWSFEFEGKEYFEGFRSLATNGVDKPILNFFRMAGEMKGERVAAESSGAIPMERLLEQGVGMGADVDAMATRAGDEAAVLVWNYSDKAEPDAPGVAREATTVEVKLNGIPAGVSRVRVREYRIDETHSNAYAVWLRMGSPQRPTKAQLKELVRRKGLEAAGGWQWVAVQDGRAAVTTRLTRQSVALMVVRYGEGKH